MTKKLSKKAMQERARKILNSTPHGVSLSEEDASFMKGLLRRHPSFKKITKNQNYQILTRSCHMYPRNNQFYVLLDDGTIDNFSYIKAISYPSKMSLVKQALREVVKEDVYRFRLKYFKENGDSRGYVICPITGLKIKSKEAHVDHWPIQFDTLVGDWSEVVSINLEDIELINTEETNGVWVLEDSKLLDSFYKYHQDKAVLRVVLAKANLQQKKAAK